MTEYIFKPDDLAEVNINTAQSCLIKANTSINKEEKIKSLIIAFKLLEGTLKSYGIDSNKLRIKKEKN